MVRRGVEGREQGVEEHGVVAEFVQLAAEDDCFDVAGTVEEIPAGGEWLLALRLDTVWRVTHMCQVAAEEEKVERIQLPFTRSGPDPLWKHFLVHRLQLTVQDGPLGEVWLNHLCFFFWVEF
jgi:hypothetical protein